MSGDLDPRRRAAAVHRHRVNVDPAGPIVSRSPPKILSNILVVRCRARGTFGAYRDMTPLVDRLASTQRPSPTRNAPHRRTSVDRKGDRGPLLGADDVAQILSLTIETLQNLHATTAGDSYVGPRARLVGGESRYTLAEVARYMQNVPCPPGDVSPDVGLSECHGAAKFLSTVHSASATYSPSISRQCERHGVVQGPA